MDAVGKTEINISEIRARSRTMPEIMIPEAVQLLPLDGSNKQTTVVDLEPKSRRLTLTQILLLNAVVCGVEICACAGFTYIPPMLLKAGYTEENMSIILGLGPLLGFFLVPLIGQGSDRCRSSFGRRRPFILVISIVLIISLIQIPYGNVLCYYVFGQSSTTKTLSLLLLTIGVVLLDFTSQACLTPCEALLSDASKDTDQYERVFIVYSLMVSLGGFIGYLITAIDWNKTTIGSYFTTQEQTVFSILTVLFTLLLSATVMVANEKPALRADSDMSERNMLETINSLTTGIESGYDTSSENGNGHLPSSVTLEPNVISQTNVSQMHTRTVRTSFMTIPKVALRLFVSCRIVTALCNVLRLAWISIHDKLPEPIQKLYDIPYVIWHLSVAHFCSWTAVMGFNLFFTDFVGNAVFHGNPNAPEDSLLRDQFDEGVRMGSWGLLLHCITSAIYAPFIERLVNRYGCKVTYSFGMVSFSIAMLGMMFISNIGLVTTMAALTGFGYATVTTIPFILVSKYHNEKEVTSYSTWFHSILIIFGLQYFF